MTNIMLDYEASFLRLLEKMTNGSTIEINHTGTMVTYHPGIISGGTIRHECPNSRGIGYFLEGISTDKYLDSHSYSFG